MGGLPIEIQVFALFYPLNKNYEVLDRRFLSFLETLKWPDAFIFLQHIFGTNVFSEWVQIDTKHLHR